MTGFNHLNRVNKLIGSGIKPWDTLKEITVSLRESDSYESPTENLLVVFKRKKSQDSISNVSLIVEPSLELTTFELPLHTSKVSAGFPSPADDHVEKRLDLNDYLIKQADATFFVRIKGESMIDAGIFDNDVVIVDRSRVPSIGDIVLAEVDGEFTIKYLAKSKQGLPRLLPANGKFTPIEIKEGIGFELLGVVTGSVRKFK